MEVVANADTNEGGDAGDRSRSGDEDCSTAFGFMVKGMRRKFGDEGGKLKFTQQCVYVLVLLSAIHHWGVVKITQDHSDREGQGVIVEWGDSFFMRAPPHWMVNLI